MPIVHLAQSYLSRVDPDTLSDRQYPIVIYEAACHCGIWAPVSSLPIEPRLSIDPARVTCRRGGCRPTLAITPCEVDSGDDVLRYVPPAR